ISQLVKAGHDVQVVATPSALKFVGEATLEGLTGKKVLSDNFTSGHMMDHISLARWADIFVVAPISANHINKFALGLADDLLTTLYLAYERTKPLYLAPAMNSVMYSHYTVQSSLEELEENGIHILEPQSGILACGENGLGKMMEPQDIFRCLNLLKSDLTSRHGRILVTFGGTREPIDGVRAITNTSTGQTGAQLADTLSDLGYEVTALAAESAVKPSRVENLIEYTDHADLNSRLKETLSTEDFRAVIHLAAVSDFTVDKIMSSDTEHTPDKNAKINSSQSLTVKLKPTLKIVNQLKTYSKNPEIKIVAFKLTNTADKNEQLAAAEKLLNSKDIDCVVHNDLNEMRPKHHQHIFNLYLRGSAVGSRIENTQELACALDRLISTQVLANNNVLNFGAKNDLMS
ncbi:MAG: bifunctional phosphopantothenoylcysteine decarboxylase/phosphopantothenate--cysteine ligase CoaBC, partial [Bdellovibrionales bacterium]|nr:bifunctional phosphopantothenoylcysteine decarboxylase/phosphopantothenate--cysteine ligase CoaBC [Bdellovibrionales bacterium]